MRENLIVSSPQAYGYPLLIKHLLTNSLSLYGDQEITYRGEFRYTYRDFRRRVGQLASALEGLGVRHGTTVAVMDWDSHRYLESYFAIPMMGATLFTRERAARAAADCLHAQRFGSRDRARARRFRAVARGNQGRAEEPAQRRRAGRRAGRTGQTRWRSRANTRSSWEPASPDFEFGDFDENTKAATFYTTGTTGDPKGVYYSHRQIVLHTMATALALSAPRSGQRIHREDVYMPITPMFHVLAWGMPFVAVTLGLKTVLPGRYLPEVCSKLQGVGEGHVSHCVPTILQMLLQQADESKQDLAGWTMVIGGAALPPALCKAAREKGIDVFAGYGMSETGPVVSLAQIPPGVTPVDAERRRPPPLTHRTGGALRRSPRRRRRDARRAARRQDAGRDRPARALPHAGLLQQAAGLRGAVGRWLPAHAGRRGDVPDGSVQIVDRIKDVIKTGGEWVSSIEIESLIGDVPGVQEAAVIGVKDEKWGERPMAFVVATPDAKIDADAVRAYLARQVESNRISKYAVPEADRIVFVAEIPKTSVGKINKKLLRERNA